MWMIYLYILAPYSYSATTRVIFHCTLEKNKSQTDIDIIDIDIIEYINYALHSIIKMDMPIMPNLI